MILWPSAGDIESCSLVVVGIGGVRRARDGRHLDGAPVAVVEVVGVSVELAQHLLTETDTTAFAFAIRRSGFV